MIRIDAHAHIWRIGRNDCTWPTPDLAPLYRDFELAELESALAANRIDRALLVQSQESERDTEWLLRCAAASSRIAGVVGWIDLARTDLANRLDQLAAAGLKGVRLMAQDRPPAWLGHPCHEPGLRLLAERSLALDALVRPRHLPALTRVAERHPTLTIVIDHGAKPDMAEDRLPEWRDALAALAACTNVACKLSGLLTELASDQDRADALPYIAALFGLFGADRLIWGSDWPVVTPRGSYGEWLAMVESALPAPALPAVLGGNAQRRYCLEAT